jgi:hypothetical protein
MGTTIEVDEEKDAAQEAALEEIRKLEKEIALADYELRIAPSSNWPSPCD